MTGCIDSSPGTTAQRRPQTLKKTFLVDVDYNQTLNSDSHIARLGKSCDDRQRQPLLVRNQQPAPVALTVTKAIFIFNHLTVIDRRKLAALFSHVLFFIGMHQLF